MSEVLVLDVGYVPHSRLSWQDAIIKVLVDRTVEVVSEYDDKWIRTVSWSVKMPSVIRLLKPVRKKKAVKFSRHAIYLRDRGQCSYCGVRLKKNEMQYEHVVPRSQGGTTTWTNITSSCGSCNSKKGGRTPEQAGMRLRSIPVKPKSLPQSDHGLTYHPSMPHAWKDFMRSAVYWHGSLEEDV